MINVGLIGTSWWAELMFLPALAAHPDGRIAMLCGRNPTTTADVAERWGIERWTVDWRELVERSDAVIVAGRNDTHAEMAMAAIRAGRAVLCEKPVALSAADATALADAAEAANVTTLVPFTYRWMPAFVWVKRLIDDGYIGRLHSLNLRYQTGYALDGQYIWRFDRGIAGGGVISDLGPHWLHCARWWCGEVSHVGAVSAACVPRADRPDGSAYERAEDSALITVRFVNGGIGTLQVTAAAYEGDGSGQIHEAEIHGSEGTLHVRCDWDRVQEVSGLRVGDAGRAKPLAIPEDIWAGTQRPTVQETFGEVFRNGSSSARAWLSAVARKEPCAPDLREGARVQVLIDAALTSAQNGGPLIDVSTTPGGVR